VRHSYYILGVCWKILSNFAHYFGICLMKYSMYLAHFLDMPTNLLLCVLWAILGYEIYHWSCWLERGKFVSPYVMSGSLSLDLTTSSTNMNLKLSTQVYIWLWLYYLRRWIRVQLMASIFSVDFWLYILNR